MNELLRLNSSGLFCRLQMKMSFEEKKEKRKKPWQARHFTSISLLLQTQQYFKRQIFLILDKTRHWAMKMVARERQISQGIQKPQPNGGCDLEQGGDRLRVTLEKWWETVKWHTGTQTRAFVVLISKADMYMAHSWRKQTAFVLPGGMLSLSNINRGH